MLTTTTADLLASAPEAHAKRCALIREAIDDRRWSQAAFGLRLLEMDVREWGDKLRALSDQCTAEENSGRLRSVVPTALQPSRMTSPVTLASLEAGLLVVANSVSRDCSMKMQRAMAEVMPAGAAFGSSSSEQVGQ